MHIPYDVLSGPVEITTGVIGAAALLVGLRKLEPRLRDRTPVLMGMMSAVVFAAQMINFPLGPLPISGHLLGGVLAAVVLGPWAGALVIGVVLLVQCLLFGDGALTALGANFVNMGLIGAVGGYALYAPIRRAIGGRTGVLIGAMVAAWFSVILSALAFAVELGLSGWSANFPSILGWIALVHAGIALGEALITGLVLRLVLLTRPDMIHDAELVEVPRARRWIETACAGLAIAVALAVFLAPFASEYPDGLEAVGQWFGFVNEEATPVFEAPIPDYVVPALDRLPKVATALAGLIGTLVVFGVGLSLARVFSRQASPSDGSPTTAAQASR
jgi:cobalt/nickel transport system permease protein